VFYAGIAAAEIQRLCSWHALQQSRHSQRHHYAVKSRAF